MEVNVEEISLFESVVVMFYLNTLLSHFIKIFDSLNSLNNNSEMLNNSRLRIKGLPGDAGYTGSTGMIGHPGKPGQNGVPGQSSSFGYKIVVIRINCK